MNDHPAGEVTVLLRALSAGQPGAADQLIALVYDELKRIARNRVSVAGKAHLEPTALVHESYVRLFSREEQTWENRHHFYWAAARAMRDVLVEAARSQQAAKRGGGQRHVDLGDDVPAAAETDAEDLLALNDALRALEAVHPETARLVMLRFFAGLTRDQISELSDLSPAAVWREWNFAKAWLLEKLGGPEAPGARRLL